MKQLGIWLDHTSAHIMEFTKDPILTTTIESKFTNQVREEAIHKNENLMHHKEQQMQREYYKKLGTIIHKYDSVLLFGPTEAKTELFNILRADHNFARIKLELKQTDKMSEPQQHAFVKEHFHPKSHL